MAERADGRKRVVIPKGKDAEEELRAIRRNERRAERRRRKKAAEAGEDPDELDSEDSPPPPTGGPGVIKTAAELKADFATAFEELGGTAGLVAWGRRYPKEFYAIWARLMIPKDAEAVAPNSLEAMLAQLDNGETVQ